MNLTLLVPWATVLARKVWHSKKSVNIDHMECHMQNVYAFEWQKIICYVGGGKTNTLTRLSHYYWWF
jgi:hypothetical protein